LWKDFSFFYITGSSGPYKRKGNNVRKRRPAILGGWFASLPHTPPPLRPPFSPVQESTPVIWGGRLGNGAYLPVIYTVRGPDFLNRATGLVPMVSLCRYVLYTVYIRYFLPLVHFYFYFFLGSFFPWAYSYYTVLIIRMYMVLVYVYIEVFFVKDFFLGWVDGHLLVPLDSASSTCDVNNGGEPQLPWVNFPSYLH